MNPLTRPAPAGEYAGCGLLAPLGERGLEGIESPTIAPLGERLNRKRRLHQPGRDGLGGLKRSACDRFD
jgi:hypothetical protein